ncbi:MAG TPA: hypothetical protein VEB64_08005 [Azospirillaceae bacterium]|nr:hypothetical protein [Azospirillaceae bacterium]
MALPVLAAMSAACEPGVSRVVPGPVTSIYSPQEFSYAAGGRDLHTVVAGNPFGGDQAAFARRVTNLMQGKHFGPRTHFTTMPNETARRDYRVMMVFNPGDAMTATGLCEREVIPTAPPSASTGQPRSIQLQAVFCRGSSLASTATGWVEGVTSPEDGSFESLVGSTTMALFPQEDPTRGGQRLCPFLGGC